MDSDQQPPIVREERVGDQIRRGLNGENDETYVVGEMVREQPVREIVHGEIVPGAEVKLPGKETFGEKIVRAHAEDVEMHDAEVRAQNPPIIVEN